jgi:hypothetical protein
MLPQETRDWARQLLANEAADETSVTTGPAFLRVYEKLRRSLCAFAGIAGFRALATRALTLAKAEAPSLRALQVTADGDLQGLSEIEPQTEMHNGEDGEVSLIAHLLGLLITFIGESLTLRLVQDAWPEAGRENCNSGDGATA